MQLRFHDTLGKQLTGLFPLRSGGLLVQHETANGTVFLTLLNAQLHKEATRVLVKPTLPELWRHYLPQGPLLSEAKDALMLSPSQAFEYQASQAPNFSKNGAFFQWVVGKADRSPYPQRLGCALGSHQYLLLQYVPTKHRKKITRSPALFVYEHGNTALHVSKELRFLESPLYLTSLCSPKKDCFCTADTARGIKVWYLHQDYSKPLRTRSSNLVLFEHIPFDAPGYVLRDMRAISETEVVLLASSFERYIPEGVPKKDLLVKVNLKTHAIVNLESPSQAPLQWQDAIQHPAVPHLFLVSQADRHGNKTYFFDAETLSLQSIPIRHGFQAHGFTAEGALLIRNQSTFNVIEVAALRHYMQTTAVLTQHLEPACVKLVTGYLGQKKLGPPFSHFYKQKEAGKITSWVIEDKADSSPDTAQEERHKKKLNPHAHSDSDSDHDFAPSP